MKTAPISVVIPARNAERFIEEAIRSVQTQSVSVAEIIVVADDCSDRTREIALGLGAGVLEHTRHNISAGLNLGIMGSSQPWIAFLDADDWWNRKKIEYQWEAIARFPQAAMVSCDFFTMYPHVAATTSPKRKRERWKDVENAVRKQNVYYAERVDGGFLTRFFLATPTAIVRRDVFSEVGLFDEELLFGQTLECFARVLAKYPLVFVQKPLTYNRVHEDSHTGNGTGYWTSYISIVNKMLKYSDRYAHGAGEAHREYFKANFVQVEQRMAKAKSESLAAQL